MRKMLILAATSLVASAGCYKVSHTTGAPKAGGSHTEKASFFI